MTKSSETIIDELGIELLVGYSYDKTPGYYEEAGNPSTEVSEMIYTELTSVEVVIKGTGIDILSQMTEKQKDYVISQLQYE